MPTNNGFNAIFLPLLGLKVAENGSEFSWDPFRSFEVETRAKSRCPMQFAERE